MNRRAAGSMIVASALIALFPSMGHAADGEVAHVNYSAMKWADLQPGGWDVRSVYRKFDLASIQDLEDRDPRALKVMRELTVALDKAPIDPELDGRPVKLHGFVVVLEGTPEAMREFLLVPWQGGCIHTPPPGLNQVVRVIAKEPVRGIDLNYPIYVFGKLAARSAVTRVAKAGYTLSLDRVEPYPWQTMRRADW